MSQATLAAMRLPTERATCELCPPATGAAPVASGWDFEYATTREEFRIVRCAGCGLHYLADRPAPEALGIVYPSNYYAFDESGHQNRLVRAVRERLEARKVAVYRRWLGDRSRAVLDVGCGDGRLLDLLRRHGPGTWRLHGVEVSGTAAARASAKGYPVACGNFETLELRDWRGAFDLVLMHQVLEHTRSPRQAVAKVRELLAPGGLFSIETPDTRSWDRALFGRRWWGGWHIPRHFYLFDRSTLPRLLAAEGFDVVSCRSILSPVFWIHSVHNLLVESRGLGGLARFVHYQNPLLLAAATAIDLLQLGLARRSSNLQLLARRRGG